MSCSQCLNNTVSCANCQLNALQNQYNNYNNQSWQNVAQNQQTINNANYNQIQQMRASAFIGTATPLMKNLDQSIDDTLENLIANTQARLIQSYADLVSDFGDQLMTTEEFIKLKFIDKLNEETIQEMIKDKLIKLIKLKVFK